MQYKKTLLEGKAELHFNAGLIDEKVVVTLKSAEFGDIAINLDIVKILDEVTNLIPGHMDDTFLDPLIKNLVAMKSSRSAK